MPTVFADPESGLLDDLVRLDRYRLARPEAPAYEAVTARCRATLEREGCVRLRGFLRAGALRGMAAEIAALAGKATPIEEAVSAYARPSLTTALALDDPRRIELPRRAAHVTRDMIPPDAVAHRLYVSPMFKRFAAACAGQSRVFEYADPLAGLVATVLPPTGTLPWHYDTNEFVLTIMVQAPEEGGRFEYVPALRRPGDENLPGLARVLEGRAEDEIRGADLVPGDLQIFR
jgi:hypothetical protein